MRGSKKGRFLILKISATDSVFKAFAANPYTVSVGIATTFPSLSNFTAFDICLAVFRN